MTERAMPLGGVRVVEISDGRGEVAMRFLADLGADVVRIESDAARGGRDRSIAGGVSTYHEVFNANKRSLALDLATPAGRSTLFSLLPHIDVVFVSLAAAEIHRLRLTPEALRAEHPDLIVTTLTDFGLDGPWRDWTGTEWVHSALGGALARSGAPGREPLLPPLEMATQGAALQAAWATMAALAQRDTGGGGDGVDVAVHEAVIQIIDPPFGMAGSAAGGRPVSGGPRGREDYSYRYPFFATSDGWVRITILSPRQWQGMFEWLGRPERFADAEWNSLIVRFERFEELYPHIEELFATLTCAEVTASAARYGVPATTVQTLAGTLEHPHYRARRVYTEREVAGVPIVHVDGFVEFDGERVGVRTPAPEVGAHTDEVLIEWTAERPETPTGPLGRSGDARPGLPFSGLRVLDFGVIVAGGETGRLLADLGADVIKVENRGVPDGSRQSVGGVPMNIVFAWGNRNKSSFGVDAKDPRGRELVLDLVRDADVILSNFKPGTLAKLGLDYDALRTINPSILVVESSAFGHTGPLAANPGYGPIVRAATGVSGLWRYDDAPGFFDDVTIFPDHVAARVTATAVAARLHERRRTGIGGTVHVAQTEVVLGQHAHLLAAEALEPGRTAAVGNRPGGPTLRGLYAAEVDDDWVVVDVADDAQTRALAALLGVGLPDGTPPARDVLDAAVAGWIGAQCAAVAAARLQEAGVPAGHMVRVEEILSLPQVEHRRSFRTERHPLLDEDMPSEGAPARFTRMRAIDIRPAPVLGEHTRDIAAHVLGLAPSQIEALVREGVLHEDADALDRLRMLGALAEVRAAPAEEEARHVAVLGMNS